MSDLTAWLSELSSIAPGTDRTLLRLLAALLASDCAVDPLLIVADALRDTIVELTLANRSRAAAEMFALARIVSAEAAMRPQRRRGDFW